MRITLSSLLLLTLASASSALRHPLEHYEEKFRAWIKVWCECVLVYVYESSSIIVTFCNFFLCTHTHSHTHNRPTRYTLLRGVTGTTVYTSLLVRVCVYVCLCMCVLN